MLTCTVLKPGEDIKDCAAVRIEVFVEEQHIPLSEEFDDDDARATHILYQAGSAPVATGRILDLGDGKFQLGRIAVRKRMRGTGQGRTLMEGMMREARAQGARTLHISAQVQAIGFYEKLGFVVCADVHDECGIPHRNMVREA